MLLKLDEGLWTEIPNDATEEVKAAKIAKYNKEKEEKQARFIKACKTVFNPQITHSHQRTIGALYDKRVSISSLFSLNKGNI